MWLDVRCKRLSLRRRCPDNLPDGYRVTIRLKALPTLDTKDQVMANGFVSFQLLKFMSGENGRSTQERLLNLGISPNQSMASIAAVLRQRIVDEWQGPFVDEYQQFFHDSEFDVYTEAENFRQSGEFSHPLGDVMPLAMAKILHMPIVLITSAQKYAYSYNNAKTYYG